MSRKFHRANRDANDGDICAAFLAHGCRVQDLTGVGDGCPDKLVDIFGVNVLVEIKTPKGKLRDKQAEFIAAWRGPCEVVRSIEEAGQVVKKYKGGKR